MHYLISVLLTLPNKINIIYTNNNIFISYETESECLSFYGEILITDQILVSQMVQSNITAQKCPSQINQDKFFLSAMLFCLINQLMCCVMLNNYMGEQCVGVGE